MKKRRAVMAAVAVVCAGVIAVGLSGCEWFSFDGRRKTPTSVSDNLGYYGSDTAAWLTSESQSSLEARWQEYRDAVEAKLFTEDELSFADYLKAMNEDAASLSASLRSSVLIQTKSGAGSGVIYSIADEANEDGSKNAYVVTNDHVISGSNDIYTYLYGDKYDAQYILSTALKTTKIGSSQSEDVAVLSVEIPQERINFVQSICDNVGTHDSDKAKAGEKVYAIGNPLGYGISVLSGTIGMEIDDSLATAQFSQLSMRIDAPVTHGNSGGGLFDREGKLVGIVYGGLDEKVMSSDGKGTTDISITGFGLAIPANRALSVAQCIIDNYEYPESADSKGTATYGLLGTTEVKSSRGEFNPLTQTVDIIEEVVITGVNSKSPFYKDAENIKDEDKKKVLKSIVAKNKDRETVDLEITRMHQVETVLFNIRMGDTVTLYFTDGSSVSATYDELSHFSIKA